MKNLLAYLPALLIFLASCATPQRCAKYCTGTDSTIITVHDTVVQVQIVPDTASAAAPAPCPDIAPVIAATGNARARAWISDSTLHVEASQSGTVSTPVPTKTIERIRYRYIYIPCEGDGQFKLMSLMVFLGGLIVLLLYSFKKPWR